MKDTFMFDLSFEEYFDDLKRLCVLGFDNFGINSRGIICISNTCCRRENYSKKYFFISKVNNEFRMLYKDYFDKKLFVSDLLLDSILTLLYNYYKIDNISIRFVEDYDSLYDGVLYFCKECNTIFYSAVNFCSICGRKIIAKNKKIKYDGEIINKNKC